MGQHDAWTAICRDRKRPLQQTIYPNRERVKRRVHGPVLLAEAVAAHTVALRSGAGHFHGQQYLQHSAQ